MNSLKGLFLALILAVLLLGLPLCASGEAQKDPVIVPSIIIGANAPVKDHEYASAPDEAKVYYKDEHDNVVLMDETELPPALAYNQMLVQNNMLLDGSQRWMTYEEALSYYPTLALPETFKGCRMDGCTIRIYDYQTDINSTRGEIYEVDIRPKNILFIEAIYSDGQTIYSIDFYPIAAIDSSYILKAVSDKGHLMLDAESHRILGVYLFQGAAAMRVQVGNTVEKPFLEIWPGLFVHSFGPEQSITEENAADYLADPEIRALFDALIAFVHDDADTMPPRDRPCSQCGKGEIKIVSCGEWSAWLLTSYNQFRTCAAFSGLKDFQQSRSRPVTEACTYCIYTATVPQTEYRYYCPHK